MPHDTYVTEDGVTVTAGSHVYNYYDMEPGIIESDCGRDDGWFYFRPDSGRQRQVLNGQRVCSMAFARRRGFRGADK